jgi:DNA invertase Pin-like site-specific DNA recombinase
VPPRKNKKSQPVVDRRCVAYIRVSTENQADNGSSLEAQTAKLEAFAKLYDLEIVDTFTDAGLSASTLDRSGLQQALAALEFGTASTLIVVKLDRLTRSLRDLNTLVDDYFKDRFRLMSASEQIDTSTAGGRMMLNVLTAISQWEREAAIERTVTVMQHLQSTGKYTGGFPPYGYTADEEGNLIEHPGEQIIVRRARELRAQGHTLRAVACALGTNQRTGKPFAASQIARMM